MSRIGPPHGGRTAPRLRTDRQVVDGVAMSTAHRAPVAIGTEALCARRHAAPATGHRGEAVTTATPASRLLPLLGWLPSYPRNWLRADLVAGLTTAAVVIPKAMAYATVAGLPVEIGLYTAFVPMAVYAVLGTSRPLSVSTTTTIAILAA